MRQVNTAILGRGAHLAITSFIVFDDTFQSRLAYAASVINEIACVNMTADGKTNLWLTIDSIPVNSFVR